MITKRKRNVQAPEGKRLAKMRWEDGMTIKAIAEKTGRAAVTVRRWTLQFMPLNNNGTLGPDQDPIKSNSFEKSVLKASSSTPLEAMIEAVTSLEALHNELEEINGKIIKATEKYDNAILRFKPRTLTK
jgi:transposase-like protein